tara:strand:- start:2932 stop:3114 length:183 start_codon:yes stop_codon:yes gene_type:complete
MNMLDVEVSDNKTGTVYLTDDRGSRQIIVSAVEIPQLIAQLAKAMDDFRSSIKWEWKDAD